MKPHQALAAWLKDSKFDAALITKPENVLYLTGFIESVPAEMFGFVLRTPTQTVLVCDSRYTGHAQTVVPQSIKVLEYPKDKAELKKLDSKLVCAYEDSVAVAKLSFLKRQFPALAWRKKPGGFDFMRRIKTKTEIDHIKQAQARVDKDLVKTLGSLLKKGVTEKQVQHQLNQVLTNDAWYELSFATQVSFGENAAIPHHNSGDRPLKWGDNVLVDCGIKVEGYCSDMTRNFVFGPASDQYLADYQLLLQAQQKTLQKVKAGVTGKSLDKFCRQHMGDTAKLFTHSLGHGVGLEIHEAPTLSSRSKDRLQAGEVVTVEPGVYRAGKYGIRIEDCVVVEPDGYELLTKTPKSLLSFSEDRRVQTLIDVA